MVPESELAAFDIDKSGEPGQSEEFDAPECYYSGNEHGFWVMLVTDEGIDAWLDGTYNAEIGEIDSVDGFRAITTYTDLDPNACDVVVDVADGQYLMTTVQPDDTDATFSESCELAHELAESAMSGLGK